MEPVRGYRAGRAHSPLSSGLPEPPRPITAMLPISSIGTAFRIAPLDSARPRALISRLALD